MGEFSISNAVAGATALLTFLSLYFGLPVVGLTPGPVGLVVSAVGFALMAGLFVITGENLVEHAIKMLLLALLTGILWILRPKAGFLFTCAVLASACGIAGTAVEQRLVRRHKERVHPDKERTG